jgi:hypothetical protein
MKWGSKYTFSAGNDRENTKQLVVSGVNTGVVSDHQGK